MSPPLVVQSIHWTPSSWSFVAHLASQTKLRRWERKTSRWSRISRRVDPQWEPRFCCQCERRDLGRTWTEWAATRACPTAAGVMTGRMQSWSSPPRRTWPAHSSWDLTAQESEPVSGAADPWLSVRGTGPSCELVGLKLAGLCVGWAGDTWPVASFFKPVILAWCNNKVIKPPVLLLGSHYCQDVEKKKTRLNTRKCICVQVIGNNLLVVTPCDLCLSNKLPRWLDTWLHSFLEFLFLFICFCFLTLWSLLPQCRVSSTLSNILYEGTALQPLMWDAKVLF